MVEGGGDNSKVRDIPNTYVCFFVIVLRKVEDYMYVHTSIEEEHAHEIYLIGKKIRFCDYMYILCKRTMHREKSILNHTIKETRAEH